MEEFYTRQKANEGVKLPLTLPDGSETDHWIQVRGVDSDIFRQAEASGKRKAIELAQIEDPQKRAEEVYRTELESIAALVVSWSFPKECTIENIVSFLSEAPQIADAINRFAAQRKLFFAKKPKPSATGQNTK